MQEWHAVLTGYDGGFSRWGGDGDRDVDGVAVEASLAGPGGVPLVVSILLFFSKTQTAPHCLQRTGGEAVLLSIRLPVPGERDAHLTTDIIILCSQGALSFFCQNRSMRKVSCPSGKQSTAYGNKLELNYF